MNIFLNYDFRAPHAGEGDSYHTTGHVQTARLIASHIGGIFTLLSLVDLSRMPLGNATDIEEVSRSLNDVGDLGSRLAGVICTKEWDLAERLDIQEVTQ